MRIFLAMAALLTVTTTGFGGQSGSRPLTGDLRYDLFGGGPGPLARPWTPAPALQEGTAAASGEKSPWLAGAMSFILPGSGEIYAGSYLKGALFLAVEAAMWGLAWHYDSQGDDLTAEYKAYADLHWSATRYVDWTLAHLGTLNPTLTTPADDYRDLIYPEDGPPCDPPFSCVDWVELNAMERDIASGVLNGYTHSLPYYGEQQYYELIGKYEQFSRGWDDSGDRNPELENAVPIRSTSNRFFEYAKMRARANDKYDMASTFVSVAVVNHVLSAIDAFWTVSRSNRALRAEVRMNIRRTPFGPVSVPTASVRYSF